MRLDLRILIPAALATAAVFFPAATTSAQTGLPGRCPDHFSPAPVAIAGGQGRDKNDNGWICVKSTPGNGNPQTDDKEIVDDELL